MKGHDYERCLEQVKRQAIICEKLELKENVTLPCLRKENWQRIEKKRRILNISSKGSVDPRTGALIPDDMNPHGTRADLGSSRIKP